MEKGLIAQFMNRVTAMPRQWFFTRKRRKAHPHRDGEDHKADKRPNRQIDLSELRCGYRVERQRKVLAEGNACEDAEYNQRGKTAFEFSQERHPANEEGTTRPDSM